jgi:hypothetical protein
MEPEAEKTLEQSFFSSTNGPSYQLKEGALSDSSLRARPRLIASQTGSYGANADREDTMSSPSFFEADAADDVPNGRRMTDKTHLLTEKIRKNKQGTMSAGANSCFV